MHTPVWSFPLCLYQWILNTHMCCNKKLRCRFSRLWINRQRDRSFRLVHCPASWRDNLNYYYSYKTLYIHNKKAQIFALYLKAYAFNVHYTYLQQLTYACPVDLNVWFALASLLRRAEVMSRIHINNIAVRQCWSAFASFASSPSS